MKKIAFIFIFSISLFMFQFKSLEASSELPVGKNYLSISNLLLSSDNNYLAKTISPIKVVPNLAYTMVLSYTFLGQHAGNIDYYSIYITELPSLTTHELAFEVDDMNQRAYIEFTPGTDLIHIEDIPMIPENYNAIMYQGTYQEFSGYEPYLHTDETLDYYGVIPINYDDLLSLATLQAMVTANNPYHQGVEISILTDEYSLSNQLPGSYQIVFQAIYNQIVKRYHLDVRVYDITKPTLTNDEEFNIPLTEKIPINEIISFVQITDNIDTITHEELIILEDTYSSASSVGSYYVLLQATDSSTNSTTLRVNIELIDRMAPTISGPPEIYVYATDIPLTTAYIQSLFHIIDDVDGTNVTIDWLSDGYTQNQQPGIYQMTIRAKDSQLNTSTKQINVHVIENRGPVFEDDEIIMDVSVHHQMTHQEIIDWFIDLSINMGAEATHVRIIYNEYELGDKSEGNYYIYLSYLLDGVETTSRVMINVAEDESTNMLIYYAIGSAFIVASSALFILKKKKN